MDPNNPELFDLDQQTPSLRMASRLARAATAGHYDELRVSGSGEQFTPAWTSFFEHLGSAGFAELNHRSVDLARQIRDNGVSYNVYADASGPQRPWSLDLFPLILTPQDWQVIEAGVSQRASLLEKIMADVYGPQELLKAGLLPAELIQGHPAYMRPLHGVQPTGGTYLHIVAFDLARGPDGNWWIVSQRTQVPSGLGYLLENRISISRQFPQAFEAMHVQRLASTYRRFIEALKQASPAGADSHIALLTPGPYNETYFEHAYLARYLGLTLVEGADLLVRDQRLYLKTMRGLEPVHGLLKRLDDEFMDPLELRADSTLGVPGLLQVIRAGQLTVANALGSAFLESSALLGFLPALAQHVIGEELHMPALPTWWCGEQAVMQDALARLGSSVIKPTFTDPVNGFEAVLGGGLSPNALKEWAKRIQRDGVSHTLQSYLPPSQMPTWRGDCIEPCSVILRVFAVAQGPKAWHVLPGGLARLVTAHAGMASMQRGGSSADTWVMTDGDIDRTTLLAPHHSNPALTQRKRLVTSRAAENLFWLGRYTERSENSIRLARLILESLNGQDPCSPALLDWLSDLAHNNSLVLPSVPDARMARRVFERSLIASLGSKELAASVGYNLRSLKQAAAAVRERLSQEHWNVITQAEAELTHRCQSHTIHGDYSATSALRVLETASGHLAAITGAQTDRMTRDDGWRLLSIGRHIERLSFLSSVLAKGLHSGVVHDHGGFEAMIALFDNTITFHSRYQQSHEVAALLDLLVLERDNPRSLGWVAQTLRSRLARLAGRHPGEFDELAMLVPDPHQWTLESVCQLNADGSYAVLAQLLMACTESTWRVSDEINHRYFTHTTAYGQSLLT